MDLSVRCPSSILGGDPFNQFRFLYRRDLWWKLNDPEYCLSVMRAAYEAGNKAFELSFEDNVRLFQRLKAETNGNVVGFGNPTWEQGVLLNGRFLQYERDRILRTLVDRLWPREIASMVEKELATEAAMVFGYDNSAEPLTDKDIAAIILDEDILLSRLQTLRDCKYMFFGGSDADWLVSLGRADVLADIARVIKNQGYVPILLCHYATIVVPAAEDMALDTAAYAIPFNRDWSWFDKDKCIEIVQSLKKPVIAFMPLASGELRKDIRGALTWLYDDMAVETILFGTTTAPHARETVKIAQSCRDTADVKRVVRKAYAAH